MTRKHRITWVLLLSLVLQGVVAQAYPRVPAPVVEAPAHHQSCHSDTAAPTVAKPMASCCCGDQPGACHAAGAALPVSVPVIAMAPREGALIAPESRPPPAPPGAVYRPPIA